MQTYNFSRQFFVLPIVGVITLFFSPYLHSQSPSIQSPSIQGPTAPTITAPTITGPTAPTAPVVGTSSTTTTTTSQSTSNTNKDDSSTSLANSALSSELTATALQALTSFSGSETDADDLSSLGGLGTLSSLLGSSDSGIQNTANTTSTNLLLTQVLQKLDTVLASIEENKIVETQTTVGQQIAPQNFSQILRFSSTSAPTNGQNASVYDILNTCRSIFISKPESDGTFLLTCDRVYNADGAVQNETFYMLFKAIKTDTFEVAVSVQQASENKNSVLYRLSQYSPLSASRTGNLVALLSQNPAPQVDLLLDIDFTID